MNDIIKVSKIHTECFETYFGKGSFVELYIRSIGSYNDTLADETWYHTWEENGVGDVWTNHCAAMGTVLW